MLRSWPPIDRRQSCRQNSSTLGRRDGSCALGRSGHALDEEFIDVRVEVVGRTSPLLPNCTAELERLTDHQRVRPMELSPGLPGEAAQLS